MPKADSPEVLQSKRPLLAVALALAATLAVLFHESLFEGKVLTQIDALGVFEPWKSAQAEDFVPKNTLLLDQSLGFLPWMHFEADQVRDFELPLWEPHSYCGEPLVGTYQSAIYWPLDWIYYLLPTWHTQAWVCFFKLLMTGMFTVLFLRKLAVPTEAAAVGGLGFMLCGFQIAWLNHPHSNVAMLMPAILWIIERMAHRPGRKNAALFGFVVGVQFLGGHIQTSVHIAMFTIAYALFRMAASVRGTKLSIHGLLWLGAGAILGLLLAMPQILPFLEFLSHSQANTIFENQDLIESKNLIAQSIMMVDPNHYGAPHTHDYTGINEPSLNYNELVGGYVGRVLLLLAGLQVFWLGWRSEYRKTVIFFAVAVAFAALVAYRVTPFYDIVHEIPKLKSTKLMRFFLFVAFGISVLGSMGLAALCARWGKRKNVAAGAFALVAIELVWFAHGYNPEVDPASILPETKVTSYLQEHQGQHRALAVENGVILRPNANVFYRINMVTGYNSMEDEYLADLLLAATTKEEPLPFISEITGFDRLESLGLMSLLGVKHILSFNGIGLPIVLDDKASNIKISENPSVLPRAFLCEDVTVIEDPEARVTHMTSADFKPRTGILAAESEALNLYRDDPSATKGTWAQTLGIDTTPAPKDQAKLSRYAPRGIEISVTATQRRLMILSDTWDSGWHAEISASSGGNGGSIDAEIIRVDHALRGIWIEPGSWKVSLHYSPWTTKLGLVLAALAAAVISVLFIGQTRRKEGDSEPAQA